MKTFKCTSCGTDFQRRKGNPSHCSAQCLGITLQKRIAKECTICGNPFEVKMYRQFSASYCSRKCKGIAGRTVPTKELITERFWERVERKSLDECWEWQSTIGAQGYGVLYIGNEQVKAAHRISYELHYGPIPELPGHHGACICHKCDNRKCVNPNHLFVGTQKDNMYDAIQKGHMPWSK